MTCEACGVGQVVAVDVPEPSDTGHFQEEHECSNCGAKMFVSGKEQEPPHKWNRFGGAVDG